MISTARNTYATQDGVIETNFAHAGLKKYLYNGELSTVCPPLYLATLDISFGVK